MWISKELEFEGLPLMLRYRSARPTKELMQGKDVLLRVTHRFSSFLSNGLPEPSYNEGLATLDLTILRMFSDNEGLAMLVETFGRKRNYYLYCTESADPDEKFQAIKDKFSDEVLAAEQYDDPDWSFVERFNNSFSLWT